MFSYSFDLNDEGLEVSYQKHRDAYVKTFDRLGLKYNIVSAMSGAMGGSRSEEFLAPCPTGEDTYVLCNKCGYAANVEAMVTKVAPYTGSAAGAMEIFDSPNTPTIDSLVKLVNQKFGPGHKGSDTLKNVLVYMVGHDISTMYELQAQYGSLKYDGTKNQIPAWIREGSAQLIGLMVVNDLRNSGGSYVDLEGDSFFVGPKPESICSKDLQDAEGKEKIMPDQCSRAMHLYAVKLLVAKFGGLEALFKFHKLYGQTNDWVSAFKESFGITREDFYKEWWSYLGIPRSDWPDLQPPTAPERY